MRAKTFTDAVFTAAYTVGAAASAAEAARALDTAGLSGAMALATAPTGGGGVAFGSTAVAELAESAVMSGVSFVSARMADRSQGIFRADMQKLEIIPRFRVFRGISARNIIEKSADEANAFWAERNLNYPPYEANTKVFEFELTEDTKFVRVFKEGSMSGEKGQWCMKAEDIKGLSPEQIADKFALQEIPDKIVEVRLSATTGIRGGIAGEQPQWGRNGGGIQFDLMDKIVGEFIPLGDLSAWLLGV